MSEKTPDAEKLDGFTIDQALNVLLDAYRVQQAKDSTSVKDPNTERARRISSNVKGIEKIVTDVLGSSVRASKENAEAVIGKLAYELARADGYGGKPEDLPEQRKAEYLTNAGRALENPTIGNKLEFIKSIMNLASAKPGDPLYDSNSPLALLINYIATKNDEESSKINYLNQLVQAAWQQPDKGLKLQTGFNKEFGFKLAPSATAGEALTELRNFGTRQTQKYVESLPKTYQAPQSQLDKAA